MNAKQRELQTVQLTYQRNGLLPLTVREMECQARVVDYTAHEQTSEAMRVASMYVSNVVSDLCEENDRLRREIAWLSAKLDTYERPHDLVRGS